MHEEALEKNPDDAYAWFKRGVMLGRLDRFEEALASINRSLELVPRTPDVPTRPAPSSEDESEWRPESCDEPHWKGAGSHYNSRDVWNEKADIFEKLGLIEKQLECHRVITELYPRYSFGWLSRGSLLVRHKRYREALTCYERAMKIHLFDDFFDEEECTQGIEECRKHLAT